MVTVISVTDDGKELALELGTYHAVFSAVQWHTLANLEHFFIAVNNERQRVNS